VPDLRITELQTLAGADLAAGDYLPLADVSASESKKITVTDFLGNAITLLADSTIPSGKIVFNNNTVSGSALINNSVTATQLADDAVTAAKLADSSSVQFVATLPASGAFTGQLAVDIATLATYAWNGSIWQSIKAAGSINSVIGGSTGIVNITVTQTGDAVTINTTLDNTTGAAQFLAGPTGSAGAVSYRLIAAADLPTATTSAKGAVRVNGSGLTMNGDQLQINNTVAANTSVYHLVRYDANGLITDGRLITSGDLPAAAAGTLGAIYPGTGLSVSTGGQLNHTNSAATGTYTKVTIDGQGHVTAGSGLQAADIPDLDTAKLISGQLPTDRIANDAVTGAKLANSSVTQFGGAGSTAGIVTFPTAEFTGQYFFDSINGDLYLWDGNAWKPITITSGEIIFAGTFNASVGGGTGQVASVTAAGTALGLTVGSALPAASANNNRYYLVVSVGGTITNGHAPHGTLAAPDMILSNGTEWEEIDVSTTVAGVSQASGITVVPTGNIASTNVQAALAELDSEKIGAAGATITGELLIGTTGALAFEGATANAFETYLTVADPTTADRTITLPDRSGTVITDGDTGTVTNTMLAGSIALSKLAALTSGNIIIGNASNIATAVPVSGDVTISNAGVVDIAAGTIINADINANAAIAFSKLAALNSGSILVGNASNVAAAVVPTGDVTITNAGVTSVIAGSTTTAGKLQLTDSTASTSTTTAATPAAVKTAYDLANAALPKTGGALTGDITLNAQSDLRFADADSSNWLAFQAPATVAANVTWTLPAVDGSANQALITNGAGALSWSALVPDASVTTAKLATGAITRTTVGESLINRTAAQTLTTTTLKDFTGIPSWARRVTVTYVSATAASGSLLIQLGVGTTPTTTGYSGASSLGGTIGSATFTNGFGVLYSASYALGSFTGAITLQQLEPGVNKWVASGVSSSTSVYTITTAGQVTLAGVLGMIRITSSTGSTFTSGSASISWE